MDNRDDLERKIEECFEKMPVEKKIDFLAQVDEMEAEEKNPGNLKFVSVKDRVIYDVERFGRPPIIYEDFELVHFLVSMSFVILEITRELLLKTKGEEELQIDDYRQILSFNDELVVKVISETAIYVANLFELEIGDYLPDDDRWCTPYRLVKIFNAVKLSLHLGKDILIDTSFFNE